MFFRLTQRASGAIVLSVALAMLAGCSKSDSAQRVVNLQNRTVTNGSAADTAVGPFHATRGDVLDQKIASGAILPISSPAAVQFLKSEAALRAGSILTQRDATTESKGTVGTPAQATSLILGYPTAYLGEQSVFGGVITQVSAVTDVNLGDLKLTDLPMLQVRSLIAGVDTAQPQLVLVGCDQNCNETSPQTALLSIPIVGVDTANHMIQLDIGALGQTLDLMSMIDPDGSGTGYLSAGSQATATDYSGVTLVFDVDSNMQPVPAAAPATNDQSNFTITTRWYLRLASSFSPSFVPRAATPGVGFFMTERNESPLITRWSETDYGTDGIHYFVKNVPADYQPAFQAALDAWNTHFQAIIGRKPLTYEFVAAGDPKNDQLVPGDVRYNIIEWDTKNVATYGGLGPSIGNQFTGELLAANVYIQGPTIIGLYTDWFKVSQNVNDLRKQGRIQEADLALHDYAVQQNAMAVRQAQNSKKMSLKLTPKLKFQIRAKTPAYFDPAADRNDFEELPANVDYKTYMAGYFTDMLSHELGHNMGLRHNFRGNLGATDTGEIGSVSRSVMEYLGRRYRYLDRIDTYDDMAISYGYTGKLPTATDEYCTDEDSTPTADPSISAECNSSDATSDPYSFFEFRLAECIDYLTARGQSYAPTWKIDDLSANLAIAVNGLISYATSAAKTSGTWTNFGKTARPAAADVTQMKQFVLAALKQQICDPNLDLVVASKFDPASKAATQANIDALRSQVSSLAAQLQIYSTEDLSCVPGSGPASQL